MGDVINPEAMSSTAEATPPSPPSQSHSQPRSYPPPEVVTPNITLQAPLSRRGHGPGLILVIDHYALLDASAKHLDPPPLVKWAEEGFAVCQILVPGKVGDGGEFPLERAIEALRNCAGCDGDGESVKFGVISYLTRLPFYIQEAVCVSPKIAAIISYGGTTFSSINSDAEPLPPQLIHAAGAKTTRRQSTPLVPDITHPETQRPAPGFSKTRRYPRAKADTLWVLPADENYHAQSAALAHTRSLLFLKQKLNGPWFDLEAVWDEHCRFEFAERDVAKTMATMVAQPYVNHIPTMTGGIGKERLVAFYTHHFIFANPADTELDLVSRTVGTDRIVDEFVFKLTHDRQVDWLLPGVPPTGRHLKIPFVSVVGVRGDRLCHEHIHWDSGTALRQAGLLPEWVSFDGAIEGEERGEGKRFEIRLPVGGEETAGKLVDEGSVESNGLMGKGWRLVDDV